MNAVTSTLPLSPLRPTAPLEARELVVAHDRQVIIDGLDLRLEPGQVTAIVGPNGCGKSTLLNALARVLRPLGGSILLDGTEIHRQPAREVARRLALLPQDTSAPEGMTVEDLVRFGRQPHQGWLRQWSSEDRAAVARALDAADLRGLEQRVLDQLSGGQRQRAWIAMAIAQSTPLLLLDEPTSALDLGHQIEIFELIRTLAARGKTVAMVVHDLASACRYADQLIAMRDGRIMARGAPGEILTAGLVRRLYGVDCDIIPDPVNGSPMLINVRRARG
ncbi:cobalamin/Fe(3+)-siderophore ABC transporter ATP-binding protein [Zobellella endophytica]|uniref:Cobalamin/Fe(3+)-siderophore ABC transporter ATP-binding protein n=1 Tax=Zobellella endophytica TaxID=2116700 RepID=A0A2P7R1H7_9GAMM|nr:ABC transporter ATP-binding protein [Zobellella endophytica]PSJ44067.1 cobalamin/Fe(3+)-siderophore ABC transporter ATP-binding protein [Zobellella endophytica]